MRLNPGRTGLFILLLLSVLILVHFRFGLQVLIPSNVDWLLIDCSDWMAHYLSWEYYLSTSWQFPIGTIENYIYPLKSHVGMSDSIPLFAYIFKILSPLFPDHFQYFGIWFFISFLMQGFFAYKLLDYLGLDKPLLLFPSILFLTISPVLLNRLGHPALCSHWLILAGVYIYLKNEYSIRKKVFYQLILITLSALIHPYMVLFSFGIALADFIP